MKIHDILRQVTEPGELLTYAEIKQKVLKRHPEIKPRSIVPSEHMLGKLGVCKLCHRWPLFEKLEHGLYRVLPQAKKQPVLPVHDKLVQALAPWSDQLLSIAEIRQRVAEAFPETHLPSVIPLDHTIGGACRACLRAPLLGRTAQRGIYRVLPPEPPPDAVLNLPSGEQLTALAHLLQHYKPEILHLQPEAFLTELTALSELNYRELNLLANALRERIVVDLLEFGSLLEAEILHARLAQRLYEHQGIGMQLANWAVATWDAALRERFAYRYPQNQKPSATRVADPLPVAWMGPSVAGIQLRYLNQLILTSAISWLKKGRHRVAMLAYPDSHRLLGIRPAFVPKDLKGQLRNYQLQLDQLPVELPLTQQELAGYRWYALPDLASLQEALIGLDQGFGPTTHPNESKT